MTLWRVSSAGSAAGSLLARLWYIATISIYHPSFPPPCSLVYIYILYIFYSISCFQYCFITPHPLRERYTCTPCNPFSLHSTRELAKKEKEIISNIDQIKLYIFIEGSIKMYPRSRRGPLWQSVGFGDTR